METNYRLYQFETVEVEKRLILKSINCSSKCASSTVIESFDNPVSWITWLFEQSETIYKDKITYFPQDNDSTIMVLGFGSSKLESNLFKQYLNNDDWHIEKSSVIGTLTSLKQVVLASRQYSTKHKFIDAQAYTTDSSLTVFLKHSNATTLIEAIDKLISLNIKSIYYTTYNCQRMLFVLRMQSRTNNSKTISNLGSC